jgi:hypothetical protein
MFDVGLVGMIATLSLPLIVLVVSTLEDWLFDRIGFFSVFSFKVWSASFLATLSSKECWSVTRWHVAFFTFSPSSSSLVVLLSYLLCPSHLMSHALFFPSKINMVLFAVFTFVCVTGQTFAEIDQAAPGSCSNPLTYWDAIKTGACSEIACNCDAQSVSCASQTCVQLFGSFPDPPAGFTTGGTFYRPSGTTTGECQAIDAHTKVFFKNTQCQRSIQGISTGSALACCRNGTLVWNRWGSSDCTTNLQSSITISAGGCRPSSLGGFAQNNCPAGGADTCPASVTSTSTATPAAGSDGHKIFPLVLVVVVASYLAT